MPTVSNTSPLLNLALIGHLDLLQKQLGTIWIPQAVEEELRLEEELPGSRALRMAQQAGWLRVAVAQDPVRVTLLMRELDRGEAEAIALALENQAKWLLLDEREGRRVAKALGLQVTGVLGILLKARLAGDLPSLRQAMDALQREAHFYIHASLYDKLLAEAGE